MADYKIHYVKADGSSGTRIISGGSAQEAAQQAATEGYKVTRVQTVRIGGPAVRSSSTTHDGGTWSDFFSFRLLIYPIMQRWSFKLITILCVLAFFGMPFLYMHEKSDYDKGIQHQVKLLKDLKEFRNQYLESKPQLEEIEAKITEYEKLPDHVEALKEKRAERSAIVRHLAEEGARLGLTEPSHVESRMSEVEGTIKEHDSKGPRLSMYVLQMIGIPFYWVAVRVMFEIVLILFCIHDRLVEGAARA